MDPRRRQELTRYGVPAAFLAAVTIAVLLIKAGLDDGNASSPATLPTTTAPTITQPTTTISLTGATTTTTAAGRYHTIESGDTLGSIALEYDTTVEELVRLNPDVDPTALRPGDRIRVG